MRWLQSCDFQKQGKDISPENILFEGYKVVVFRLLIFIKFET